MTRFLPENMRNRLAAKGGRAFQLARLLLAAVLLGSLFVSAWPATRARAATITVTTTDDENNTDGDCSLREAVIAANHNQAVDACPAGSGADTIVLPAGNYVFSLGGMSENQAMAGDLDILGDLTIDGDGPLMTTIDAAGLDRAFEIIGGNVVLSHLTIQGGFAGTGYGSAIDQIGGSLVLDHVRLTDNTGSAAILAYTPLTISTSLIENTTDGRGVQFNTGSSGLIQNSTISGNTGGGISTAADSLVVVNSTISGNSSPGSGAGITAYDGMTSLYNVTIANNSTNTDLVGNDDGGGVYVFSSTLTARNTLIAGNFDLSTTGTNTPDCYIHPTASFDSLGYNLIQNGTGCTITGTTTGNLIGSNPLLGPLQNNGGPTFTQALQAGSPAIDAGGPVGTCRDQNNAVLFTDQRNYLRPVDGDGLAGVYCDIGAYEYNSTTTPTPSFTPYPSNTPHPATATPTHTAIPTVTASPSPSLTATSGPSPTASATSSPGPSPTATATIPLGDQPSPTPTNDGPPGGTSLYLPLIRK